ncbi:Curlin associated repeat-containing protein [Duganella sp. CF517]|uniref:hypothetical protein n=1 Tax=Duganella sp. CF517 TaxID=1881038 RepID=UPI0008AC7098|nr:hypothetical protein [Duganella sp. CF517]SEN20392.1 Curlin associated repeat-containing protein [Duganella sp. CF517]
MNHSTSTVAVGLALSLAMSAAWAQEPTTASVAQTGAGNQAYVEQRSAGERATISIVQSGNNNLIGDPAGRTGGVLMSETAAMIVEISQSGNANQLTLRHHEGGFFGFSYINQSGTGNIASLMQNGAYESTIRVEQHGERNMIDDRVEGSGALSFRPSQYGSGNVITTRRIQSGYAGLPIYQDGSDNRATVTYDNAFYSGIGIRQTGTGNEARGSMAWTGFATDAYISQDGAGNLAVTDIRESGGASTTQTGNANSAAVSQYTGSNGATVIQTGTLNTASVTQSGPWSLTPNVASITQIGEGFVAGITQTGSANSAGIHQH